MQSGGGGLYGDGGSRRGMETKRVGDRVKETARGHEGVTGGDREIKECGGGVLLSLVGGRVEDFS